jgi:hypothetical protein
MSDGLILLTDSQTILLRKFCELFPPVINDNRPTGDFELDVPEDILDREQLLREFLSSIWEAEGWDQLKRDSGMSDFRVMRIAPDRIFVMPLFRNIGFHPYTDKAGTVHNDEPYYWLDDNNWWKRSLNFLRGCQVLSATPQHQKESFNVFFNYWDGQSFKELKQIQWTAMNESFTLNDREHLLNPIDPMPSISRIEFDIPTKSFNYSSVRPMPDFERMGMAVSGSEYTSVPFHTTGLRNLMRSSDEANAGWFFLSPFEISSNPWVLNWLALKTEQFRDFISEITQ